MKWMTFFCALLWLLACKNTQSAASDRSLPLEYEISRYNTKCRYNNRFSLESRVARMPFRNAKKVVLVSYDGGIKVEPLPFEGEIRQDGLIQNPFPSNSASYAGVTFHEAISLDEKQLDGLTNILFNYAYGKDEKEIVQFVGPTCYSPQQMILFYKEPTDKEPFAWVEICLFCQKYKTFPDSFDFGVFCDSKYDLLREFFRQTGIKHGLG